MIETWPAKSPTEAKDYIWQPRLAQFDALASIAVAATSGTVSATGEVRRGELAVISVSGGAAGEEALLTLTATTYGGETLVASFYVPVRSVSPPFTNTARDVCISALRKLVGIDDTPTGKELEFALECLNDMLASWRLEGIDCGISGQLADPDTLSLPETYLAAIKLNLSIWLADQFDRELTPSLVALAGDTKRALLVDSVKLDELRFDDTLIPPRPMRSINDI